MKRIVKKKSSGIAQVGKVLLGAALIAVEKVLGKGAGESTKAKRPRNGGGRKKAAKRPASSSTRKPAQSKTRAHRKARASRPAVK